MRLVAAILVLSGPAFAAPLALDDSGTWRLTQPDLPGATGSLFAWHDAWKYEVPHDVTAHNGTVTGTLTGSNAGALVHFRVTAKAAGEGLALTYTFNRDAGTTLNSGVHLLLTLPLAPLQGRAVRFGQSDAQAATSSFGGIGDSFSVNLSDQRALTLSTASLIEFRRRTDTPDRVLVNVRLLPADFPAGRDVTVTLNVALGPAGSDGLSWQSVQHEPLAVRSARFSADRVAVNAPATLDVDLHGTWENPFDPGQITLDADLTAPDGRHLRLPGYWQQPYREVSAGGQHAAVRTGEPGWRVRFTPTQVGTWLVKLTARDRSGAVDFGPLRLTATASTLPGMARIGRNANVFVREGGGGVFLTGHNVTSYATSGKSMAETFDAMAAGGENFTRMWMYSGSLGLEWGQPLGTYRMAEAWRLDNMLELARQRGILILLCLDTHQDFREAFPNNPYHVKQGGPIDTPLGFFTNESAQAAYRQRLRYIVARWSYATNLLAWEFVNEIEGWDGFGDHKPEVAAWHSRMATTLHGLDPYQHPISTSCWTTEGQPSLWNAPGIDFVQIHHYANAKVDMGQRAAEVTAATRRDFPGRLALFAEMGINSRFSPGAGDDEDPLGLHLHDQNWAALMSGAASTPCNWWHDAYFEKHNLYGVFRGIRRLADQVNFDQPWKPVEGLQLAWTTPPTHLPPGDLTLTPRFGSWEAPPRVAVWRPAHDGGVPEADQFPQRLHGRSHRNLRIEPALELDLPAASQLVLGIGAASDNPRLVVTVDGQNVLDRVFETAAGKGRESHYSEQWKIWDTRYDEDLTVALPAGRHTVALRNDGGDWLELTGLRVAGYVTQQLPFGAVYGMSTGKELMFWQHNTRAWWLPVSRGETIPALPPTTLTVPAGVLAEGRYRLEFWDTRTGVVTSTREVSVGRGSWTVAMPEVGADVAVRVRPR